jgi:hypothetical protein
MNLVGMKVFVKAVMLVLPLAVMWAGWMAALKGFLTEWKLVETRAY